MYGAKMQISVQMTELSKVTISRCLFFLKPHSLGTLWYFAQKENATVQLRPAVFQLQTT